MVIAVLAFWILPNASIEPAGLSTGKTQRDGMGREVGGGDEDGEHM